MKAIFFPFAPSLGHVSRCLAVAEAWRANGHMAIFAVGAERTSLVQSAGFETQVVPEVSSSVFRTDLRFRWLTSKYFTQNLEAEQAILANVEPDVVVFDFRFTTALSARLAGLPCVGINQGTELLFALQPREAARLLIGDPQEMHGIAALRSRVMRRLFPVTFQLALRTIARRFDPVVRAYGLSLVNSPFDLLVGDEAFVADIPSLLPLELPSNCHFVGPLMWSGWAQPAPWLDGLDPLPLLYVTMGSTVEAQSVLVKIIDALRDACYNVVVSVGDLSLPADLKLPSHIRVFPTVPGAMVAQRSAAIIHHGGHETLMQALAAGAPSLMLPASPDQILVAQQAHALRIGHSLWQPTGLPLGTATFQRMTATQIRREIDSLVADQDCVLACKALRQEIEACRGATTAVGLLERIAK